MGGRIVGCSHEEKPGYKELDLPENANTCLWPIDELGP